MKQTHAIARHSRHRLAGWSSSWTVITRQTSITTSILTAASRASILSCRPICPTDTTVRLSVCLSPCFAVLYVKCSPTVSLYSAIGLPAVTFANLHLNVIYVTCDCMIQSWSNFTISVLYVTVNLVRWTNYILQLLISYMYTCQIKLLKWVGTVHKVIAASGLIRFSGPTYIITVV